MHLALSWQACLALLTHHVLQLELHAVEQHTCAAS